MNDNLGNQQDKSFDQGSSKYDLDNIGFYKPKIIFYAFN